MKKYILLLFVSLLFTVTSLAQSNEVRVPKQNEKIKVFPNPADNNINILGLQNSKRAAIRITDMYANVVLEHNWEIKREALNIPVAHLPKGIYVLSIQSPEQKIQTKFYKQ